MNGSHGVRSARLDVAAVVDGRAPPDVIVDMTHCGRHVTGLERIALDLFGDGRLGTLRAAHVSAGSTLGMIAAQQALLPWRALRNPCSLILCPGFPPAPLLTLLGNRVLPYIHDLFLMNRRADLNPRARLYMAPAFALAVRRLPRFLVNSDTTGKNLRAVARPDAEIIRFRPAVDNPFKLTAADRASRPAPLRSLRLVAMGTVEPRKNLTGAAAFLSALRAGPFPDATLDIIGRAGWNVDVTSLAATPGVTLHGYLGRDAAAGIMASADALLAFSHDEGLGLPLLEAQHAGLPVIANAIPVFSEVLGDSGLRVDAGDPGAAAAQVADWMSADGWRRRECARALDNVVAWNATAQSDRTAVLALIDRLLSDLR